MNRKVMLRVVVPLAIFLGLLAGAREWSSTAVPSNPAKVNPPWTACATEHFGQHSPIGPAGLLGPDFEPVLAVFCEEKSRPRDDGGLDLVVVETQVGDGPQISRLARALRLPDVPPTRTCVYVGPGVRWFALLDRDRRWVQPSVPTAGCDVRPEATAALAGLTVIRTDTTVLVSEYASAQAVAVGCPDAGLEFLSFRVNPQAQDPAEPVHLDPLATVRLCTYHSVASPGRGVLFAADHAVVIPASRWDAIRIAVAEAPPARACDQVATRFALLQPTIAITIGRIYAELDGCQRVSVTRFGTQVIQGDATLTALLSP